ncbi:hypothetical protein BOTBODRAFT_34838 [Botryobasidium botryosum FD-172 SS1]|uniref:Uncharacterized protein n=1 Tax=Botryobasidium botryosum (strain FD-172 SS1) TaxID=930990 RepID=A0A067M8V0_BOTB1|nr:hypothetical protein BOTBODRAFT_34838 [Botryobasidium botryosum FD-172 SS1]
MDRYTLAEAAFYPDTDRTTSEFSLLRSGTAPGDTSRTRTWSDESGDSNSDVIVDARGAPSERSASSLPKFNAVIADLLKLHQKMLHDPIYCKVTPSLATLLHVVDSVHEYMLLGRRCRNDKVSEALYGTIRSLAVFLEDTLADLHGWTLEYTRFHIEGFRVKFRDILKGLKSNEVVDALAYQVRSKAAERAHAAQRRSALVATINREMMHREELRSRIRALREIEVLSLAELERRCDALEIGFPSGSNLRQHPNLPSASQPLGPELGSYQGGGDSAFSQGAPHPPPAPRLAALSIESMTPPYVPTHESLAGVLTPPLTPPHPAWHWSGAQ